MTARCTPRPLARARSVGLSAAVVLVALAAGPGAARAGSGFGPHVGFSFEPDQLIAGVHAQFPVVGETVYLVPGGDVGLFDGFSIALHADGQARLGDRYSKLRPYVGAGLTWWSYDPDGDPDAESDVAPSVLFGLWSQGLGGKPTFGEVKLFLDDAFPDFRFTLGRNF